MTRFWLTPVASFFWLAGALMIVLSAFGWSAPPTLLLGCVASAAICTGGLLLVPTPFMCRLSLVLAVLWAVVWLVLMPASSPADVVLGSVISFATAGAFSLPAAVRRSGRR